MLSMVARDSQMKLAGFLPSTFVLIISSLLSVLILSGEVVAGNEKTVALVLKALTNPFWLKVEQGAREYAQKNNLEIEFFGVERESNVEHQISIIDNLILRGYGAIVIAPNDSKRIVPISKKAITQGVKVINIDNPFDKETLAEHGITIPFIGPNNFTGGEIVGGYVRSKLKGEGSVLIVEGTPGISNSDNRKNGFIRGVSTNSSITISRVEKGNWHGDEAFTAVMKALNEGADFDAVFCTNDVMALGALQALDLFGKSGQVLLAGYDNIDLVQTEMRSERFHATIEQHPEIMGAYGVKAAWESMRGEPVAEVVETPLDLITSDHLGKKLMLVVPSMEDTFYSAVIAGASREAVFFGMNLDVIDLAKMGVEIVNEKFSSSQPDILIIQSSGDSVSPVAEKAKGKGIPVLTVSHSSSSVLAGSSGPDDLGKRIIQRTARYFWRAAVGEEMDIDLKLNEK